MAKRRFHNNLQAILDADGLHQVDLVRRTGKTAQEVSRWVRCERKLDAPTLELFAKALKRTIGEILDSNHSEHSSDSAADQNGSNLPLTGGKTGEAEDDLSTKSAMEILEAIRESHNRTTAEHTELLKAILEAVRNPPPRAPNRPPQSKKPRRGRDTPKRPN